MEGCRSLASNALRQAFFFFSLEYLPNVQGAQRVILSTT